MSGQQPTKGWKAWGYKGAEKGLAISDWVGFRANKVGASFGVERFWPTTGDAVDEINKCERILRQFCVEGLPVEETVPDPTPIPADGPAAPSNSAAAAPPKKKRKVYRKIPPKIIKDAKGIVIFTAMRTGFAPFSGAGGGGIVMARMKDGSWSPPSFCSPNNMAAGFMIGVDIYNCILILRTEAAVKGFRTHHVILGAEMAITAGPLGYGISGETGLKSPKVAPIFSYVLSKGFYAGVELVGQVFIDRFDENGRVYHWKEVKAGDIFDGKVRRPVEANNLYKALMDAELGIAQGDSLEWNTEEVLTLDLDDGETLKLPPTPEQLSLFESNGIQDEEDIQREQDNKRFVKSLPPPPRHPHSRNYKARVSDTNILDGRKGMRSPELGMSASALNSPSLGAVEQDDHFASRNSTGWPSPDHSPIPQYHEQFQVVSDWPREKEVQRREEEQGSQPGPSSSAAAEHFDMVYISEALPEPEQPDSKRVSLTEVEAAQSTPLPEPTSDERDAVEQTDLATLRAPKLTHQDSTASTESMYSLASDTTIPPAYELAPERQ